jgi:hypothetical protein
MNAAPSSFDGHLHAPNTTEINKAPVQGEFFTCFPEERPLLAVAFQEKSYTVRASTIPDVPNSPRQPPKSSTKLLSNEGWGDCVLGTFLRATDDWRNGPESRSHAHTLRRLFEDVKIDAVLCIEGRPTVCVKNAVSLDDRGVEAIRSQLWNLGATTLLIVERQTEVQVFSTFVRPAKQGENLNAVLDDETLTDLESAAIALRLRKMIRRIETGAIYRDHATLFDPKEVVDQLLLSNLGELRDLICPQRDAENYRRAHALIGKFLFSSYLLDRGIIDDAYLKKNGLPAAKDMQQLLASELVSQGATLNILFKALQRDFNGSLFGDQDTSTSDTEVEHFRRFLAGEDLRSGQLSLQFKLYDFSFIPVEFISSIYQEFLAAEAEADAQPTTRNQPRNNGQRVQGAYYTPPRLAELTIDIATEGWDTLLDKRCMDGACGSGIFLVILFVRMAEEWRRRNPGAATDARYEALKSLLAHNISGVDINLTACLVTCFSLYLAFLDQMDPKAITELREALDQHKLLPRILWERKDDSAPRLPRLRTIRELDFFELNPAQDFDLVVGNPPWVSRKDAPSAERWMFSEKDNPAAKGLTKSVRKQTLFPAKEVACGFMWKASLHAKTSGRVCQVLPSRVFLSNNTDRFQAHWLKQHCLESIWLLADHRFVLFPGADCPCFIGRYRPRVEGEAFGDFDFVSPKVESFDPREALLPVQAEDQKRLSEQSMLDAAIQDRAAFGWKKHHWGTPRDIKLVERLMKLPKIERLTYQPGRGQKPKGEKCWPRGQGFQPATGSTPKPKPIPWKESDRYLAARSFVSHLVLLREQTEKIGSRYQEHRLRRSPAPQLFQAPLVLVNQGFTQFVFSDFDVFFQDSLQSISAPKADKSKLFFLTAVLSSPLAQYLGLHTSVNIGIERDKVSFEELLQLPFPLPKDMPDQAAAQRTVDECAVIFRELQDELERPQNLLARESLVAAARRKLDSKVYTYFGISKWERHLIEDGVAVSLASATPASRSSDTLVTTLPSQESHRKEYADELIGTFKGWTRTKENLWATATLAPSSGLVMLTFGVGGKPRAYAESRGEARIETLLAELRDCSSADEGAVFRRMRSFTHYEGTKVHLLKPMNRRHWTRTAAQNDADAIIAQMMEEDGWDA